MHQLTAFRAQLPQSQVGCPSQPRTAHAMFPMLKTVRLAKKYNKLVGAHPGLPDKENFGRRLMDIPPEALHAQMLYQVGSLEAMLKAEGMKLNHIKPHGKLYRMMREAVQPGGGKLSRSHSSLKPGGQVRSSFTHFNDSFLIPISCIRAE